MLHYKGNCRVTIIRRTNRDNGDEEGEGDRTFPGKLESIKRINCYCVEAFIAMIKMLLSFSSP